MEGEYVGVERRMKMVMLCGQLLSKKGKWVVVAMYVVKLSSGESSRFVLMRHP